MSNFLRARVTVTEPDGTVRECVMASVIGNANASESKKVAAAGLAIVTKMHALAGHTFPPGTAIVGTQQWKGELWFADKDGRPYYDQGGGYMLKNVDGYKALQDAVCPILRDALKATGISNAIVGTPGGVFWSGQNP